MRLPPTLICLVGLMISGAVDARTETSLELLDRARKNLQTHLEAAKKEQEAKLEKAAKEEKPGRTDREVEIAARFGGLPENYALQNAIQTLAQVRDALATDQDGEVSQTLRQLGAANVALPEDVRKDVDTLLQTLRKEQTDREEAYAREVDAACKRAGEILPKATEPKELDKPLQELTQLGAKPPGRNRYNGGENGLNSKIQAATQFVNHWQDYLFAVKQNNEEGQRNALRSLTENNTYNQILLVPRSEILARMPVKETGDNASGSSRRAARSQAQLDADAIGVLQGVKTLDEIPAALAKLTDLRKELSSQQSYSYRSDSDLGVATSGLQALMRTRLELQNGLATNVSLGASRGGDYNSRPDVENALFPLRVQLVRLALPRMLGAPENEKAADNEALDACLRRMIELAKGRKDWAAVMRGLEIKNTLANNSSGNSYMVGNSQELEAFKSFFAATNLETAGQYEQATASYLTALRSGQTDLPASVIGEHLSAIEKAHPAEHASGKEYVLNPPRSPYGDGFRAPYPPGLMRNGYDPRFPNGSPGAANDAKLAVPAAVPAPATTPAVLLPTTTPVPKAP